MNPFAVYMILLFSTEVFFLMHSVNLLYYATVVNLDPLQMVLVGTTAAITVFVFEVPTGVVADLKSRRLSIIIGYALMGLGLILEGTFPLFWTVLVAQVIGGIGWTFTSGAEQAWMVDELGSKRAGEAFVRGSQALSLGALLGIL